MEHITKRFPGVLASDDISLSVGKGEILALVGENGAGKTTLMNILMGIYQQDEGSIFINDEEVRFRGPEDAFKAGLGMVHQQYMLVPNMTVTENVALGYKKAWKPFKLDLDMVRSRVEEISSRYGLAVNPDAYIWQLSVGEQQRVELVKTLCLGAKFIILDEPTSALTPQETDELIELLKKMKNEISIIFISHKLYFLENEKDYKIIVNAIPYSVVEKIKHNFIEEITKIDLNGTSLVTVHFAVNGLDLDIHEGEIVGLAGVSGNGQKELAEAINGLRKVEKGRIEFFGEDIANKSPNYVIGCGMGYIPEERNVEGIVPAFQIKENFILKDSDDEKFSHLRFLKKKEINSNAEKLRADFDIRCPGTNTAAGALSGGNIQKVILAREITRAPKFLIAVYPTRGLDMGAMEFIHEELLKKRREGIGILLISEELDEIMNLSDRIAVIYKGVIQKVLHHGEANKKSLGVLMAGLDTEEAQND